MSTLKGILGRVLTLDPQGEAIEFHGEWVRWGEITGIIDALEAALTADGLGAGVRVGGILRNTPQVAAAIVGTIVSDRCIVTLNPMLSDEKLVADIETLGLPVIFATESEWERAPVLEAARKSGALLIAITDSKDEPVRVLQRMGAGTFRTDAHGVGIEMLTSGTTGTPKRIPLKAANFSRMILDAAAYESRDTQAEPRLSKAVSIHNSPFAHISGLFSLFNGLSAGRKICMLDRFTVEGFVDAVARHRPRVASAPPSALRMILDADVPQEKLSSLTVFRAGTAPLDPDLADAFYAKYGIPVLQNYGATEFAGGVAGWTLPDFREFGATRRGSVGRMNAGVEGRIVDAETGDPLPFGGEGLLELRGKHLGNGQDWVRTTDLAKMDEERFLWILGRADNAIIRGGFKILPDDLVRAIEGHPAVREACVLAMPDPRLGQVPVAAYVTKSDGDVSPDELKSYLRERLTAYQVPTRLMKLADLPRTPSMKPSQPALRQLFEVEA